jgi:prepilin-type processing-associated H-X9-DG protein
MMKKLNQGSFNHMYLVLIAMLVIICLTGFVGKGKTVSVEADGHTRSVVTHAVNKEAFLREQDIDLGPNDEVELSTPKLVEGSQIVVRRAVPVRLTYKDKSQVIHTAKQTVQEVVEQAGYSSTDYRAYGDVNEPVKKGMWIRVGALSKKSITEDEVVPYAIESIPDAELPRGEEMVAQEGINGRKKVQVNLLYLDGHAVGKEVLSSTEVTKMQPMIRHVGTREAEETSSRSASGRISAIHRMEATAYLPTDGSTDGITATGIAARYGVVAVDPRVIPLGTRVFIPGYGEAIAADTGGDIKGNRIDLCMENYFSCMAFGRRAVDVYVMD